METEQTTVTVPLLYSRYRTSLKKKNIVKGLLPVFTAPKSFRRP